MVYSAKSTLVMNNALTESPIPTLGKIQNPYSDYNNVLFDRL